MPGQLPECEAAGIGWKAAGAELGARGVDVVELAA
jgi:hypothetical protein